MFIPPHCPNPECPNYEKPQITSWYRRKGHYSTITFGSVPRFLCKSCRHSFSRQTFSIDYFAKKTLDYLFIYRKINDGAGLRKIGRDMNASCDSVTNRINRLARNALIAQQQIVDLLPIGEDLVLDGLQNFCVSQYFPDHYTIAAGKDSQFVYACDYATMRRAGRMTSAQKRRRAELERVFRAPRRSVEDSFSRVLKVIREKQFRRKQPLILYTDEKSDYQRSLWGKRDFREMMISGQWRHHRINSKIGRNTSNPLFAVNYIDREIRKDMASQTRETVQFPRSVSNAMLRMSLYLFDHNVFKPFRIRKMEGSHLSHAEVAGLSPVEKERIVRGFFVSRFFKPSPTMLSESVRRTVERDWVTPLKRKPEVRRKYLAG